MFKRIIVLILSFLLLALCVGTIVFINQDKQNGGQSSGVTVRFYNADGTLFKREKYKKGETVVFPEYVSPEGYYFEGWKIDGSDEIVTTYEVRSSISFYPVLSKLYVFESSFSNLVINADNGLDHYQTISFDYKVNSGSVFAVSLMSERWHNNGYEYICFGQNSCLDDIDGITVTQLSDGWCRAVIDYSSYTQYLLGIDYNPHTDYGAINRIHFCVRSSEYGAENYNLDLNNVFLKNISFNKGDL